MPAVEITATWPAIGLALLSTAAIFAAVILYARITGLRSFAKMSSFDFAATVAMGSTMAGVGMGDSSLVVGLVVLGTFFAMQATIALLRRHSSFERIVDNTPMVLMVGDHVLQRNLDRTRVTEGDIRSKLREANVYNTRNLKAVILETTGTITVIRGDDELDIDLFVDVRDHELLRPDAGNHAAGADGDHGA